MLHRERRHLYKLLKRAEQAQDPFDLARLGDKELDELLSSGQLLADNLTKAKTAKTIRSIYGADAALSRIYKALDTDLRTLPDHILAGLLRPDSSFILKNLVKALVDSRAEGKRLNTPGAAAVNGSVRPDWWRDK